MQRILFVLFSFLFVTTASAQVAVKQLLPGSNGQVLKTIAGVSTWGTVDWSEISNIPTNLGTVTQVSVGNLSPLFTSNVANATTTPSITFSLSNAGANTWFGNATGSSAAPSYNTAGALTKTDDANVTLTLGGTPTSALLKNVSLTLGWTGQLAVSRGGTGTGTLTGVVVGNGTSAMTAVAASSANQLLRRNAANNGYEFFTPSYISLTDLSAASPVTYNSATGVIGLTTGSITLGTGLTSTGTLTNRLAGSGDVNISLVSGNIVAGTGISLSGTATNRLIGSGALTINVETMTVRGFDTLAVRTIQSGDISGGTVTIPLGGTPLGDYSTGYHFAIYINGVKMPKAATSYSGTNALLSQGSLPFTVAAGDYCEVEYVRAP